MPQTIDTLANVKAKLGITGTADDTLLNTHIMELAAQLLTDYVGGRTFPAAAEASIEEYAAAHNEFVIVTRPPIDTVTKPIIKVDMLRGWGTGITALTEDTDYVVDYNAGVIQSLNGEWSPHSSPAIRTLMGPQKWSDAPKVVKVTYKGDGPANESVKYAFALLVLHYYHTIKTEVDAAYQFYSFKGTTTTQWTRDVNPAEPPSEAIPPVVRQILAPYRRYPL